MACPLRVLGLVFALLLVVLALRHSSEEDAVESRNSMPGYEQRFRAYLDKRPLLRYSLIAVLVAFHAHIFMKFGYVEMVRNFVTKVYVSAARP